MKIKNKENTNSFHTKTISENNLTKAFKGRMYRGHVEIIPEMNREPVRNLFMIKRNRFKKKRNRLTD